MESLALHNIEQTVNWEDNTSCIYVFETKRVTPRVKHMGIPVCFILEQFDNGIFVPKCEKSSDMIEDM